MSASARSDEGGIDAQPTTVAAAMTATTLKEARIRIGLPFVVCFDAFFAPLL